MKIFNPLLILWSLSLLGSIVLCYATWKEGNISEAIAWMTSSTFAASLIVYHLYIKLTQSKSETV